MECAGFLNGLGYDATVMVRSVPLRGFDRQMADLIAQSMELKGVKFLYKCLPSSVEKREDGRLNIKWVNEEGQQFSDIYDTILFAIGRKALTKDLNLPTAGIALKEGQDKIDTVNEQTTVPHIFAVGDVIEVSII